MSAVVEPLHCDGAPASSPSSYSPPPPIADPYDLGLLREEAARIKASLYKEYGTVIDRMYNETASSSSHAGGESGDQQHKRTQAEIWQDKIDELIAVQKPLRTQIKKCQHEAIQKLVDAAQDDQRRGIDVNNKLALLISLQGTSPAPPVAEGGANA